MKSFFPKSFEKGIDKDQKNALLNAMSLSNDKIWLLSYLKTKILSLVIIHAMQNLNN